ncbi:MAG: hypothetical protein SFU98_04960 [Leptospiraceae bacterium]|nr:hypothetical protein [Leptospiraceae bacterium]
MKAEKIVEGRDLNGGFNQILHSLNSSLISTSTIKTDVKDTFTVMQDEAGRVVVRDKVVVPAYNSPAPMGGQTITLSRGIEIKRYNLDDPIVGNMFEAQKDYALNNPGNLTPVKGVDPSVSYYIPSNGTMNIDGKEVSLWTQSSPIHDEIERFTTKEGAELFVNSALAFRQMQLDSGITNPKPMRTNDFTAAGFGRSRTSGGSGPHHLNYIAIDMSTIGKNGEPTGSYKLPDYDRNMTIKMIEGITKNVPKGFKLEIRFNDQDVIKHFENWKDNNQNSISVIPDANGGTGHDGHVHVGLIKI